MSFFRLRGAFLPATIALAAVSAALAAPRADAQTPRIPPDARGYQTTMMIQQAQRARAQAAPRPIAPAPPSYQASAQGVGVNVAVPTPAGTGTAPTTYVTIRGPDGEVRRFPLARGVQVEYRQQRIVLRPGQSTTIRLTPR